LREFARTALLEPLGINEWEWVADRWRRPPRSRSPRRKASCKWRLGAIGKGETEEASS
jgi:hypothetical protein